MLSKDLQITPEILFNFCLINNKKFLVLKKNMFTIFLLIPDIIYILKKDELYLELDKLIKTDMNQLLDVMNYVKRRVLEEEARKKTNNLLNRLRGRK